MQGDLHSKRFGCIPVDASSGLGHQDKLVIAADAALLKLECPDILTAWESRRECRYPEHMDEADPGLRNGQISFKKGCDVGTWLVIKRVWHLKYK